MHEALIFEYRRFNLNQVILATDLGPESEVGALASIAEQLFRGSDIESRLCHFRHHRRSWHHWTHSQCDSLREGGPLTPSTAILASCAGVDILSDLEAEFLQEMAHRNRTREGTISTATGEGNPVSEVILDL